jgi:hypothetical protein
MLENYSLVVHRARPDMGFLAEPEYFVLQDLWYGKHVQVVSMWLGSLTFPCRLPHSPGQQFLLVFSQESRPSIFFIFAST